MTSSALALLLAARSRRPSRFRHNMRVASRKRHTLVRGRCRATAARRRKTDRTGLGAISTILGRRRGRGCGAGGCRGDARRRRWRQPRRPTPPQDEISPLHSLAKRPGLRHRRRSAARLRPAIAPGRAAGGDSRSSRRPTSRPASPRAPRKSRRSDGDLDVDRQAPRRAARDLSAGGAGKAVAAAAAEKKAKSKRKPPAAGAPPL